LALAWFEHSIHLHQMRNSTTRDRDGKRGATRRDQTELQKGGKRFVVRSKAEQFKTVANKSGRIVITDQVGTIPVLRSGAGIARRAGAGSRRALLFNIKKNDSWLVARCNNPEMATQAKTMRGLVRMVRDLIACHFDENDPRQSAEVVFCARPGELLSA
jgi:hypothetical protein